MKYFDLHCDTITETYCQNKELYTNNLSIALDRGDCFEKWRQVFAIWIPDTLRGEDAFQYYCKVRDRFYRDSEKNASLLSLCKGNGFYDETKPITGILAVEGGAAIGGRLENLDILSHDGVKLMTLTWNGENEIGSGILENKPLTPFGREVCQRMEELSIVIDVSHLAERGFYDVAEITKKPFIASHSNAKTIYDHERNLTNDQIRILIERKGLIGLNFFGEFTCDQTDYVPQMEDLLPHIDHFLSLGGEDILCLGSDFDGCEPVNGLRNIQNIPNFYNLLIRKNYPQDVVDKIFYRNAETFFVEWLGPSKKHPCT